MWDISLSPPLRALGLLLPSLAKLVGASGHIAPTTSYANYVIVEPFEDNKLTSDPEIFSMIRDQLIANPDMALGGPSLNWVREALDEANALYARPSPKQTGICLVGAGETIVDVTCMRDRMARWPNGALDIVEGGRHEVLMETPAIWKRILDRSLTGAEIPGAEAQKTMFGT